MLYWHISLKECFLKELEGSKKIFDFLLKKLTNDRNVKYFEFTITWQKISENFQNFPKLTTRFKDFSSTFKLHYCHFQWLSRALNLMFKFKYFQALARSREKQANKSKWRTQRKAWMRSALIWLRFLSLIMRNECSSCSVPISTPNQDFFVNLWHARPTTDTSNPTASHCDRAPSSKKWNFRTKFIENFRTISGHFCRFHEAQDTENARFSVLINVNSWSRSVLQS